jgi:hypothetical protein
MFKALKKAITENITRVKVSYNNEKCYKCDSNQNLFLVTNDNNNSVVYCKNCNIQIVLYEYIDEEIYKEKTEVNILNVRMFNLKKKPTTVRVKISYNNEKCYKCDSNQNLSPITNDSNAVAYCKNCNIKIVLYEYIDEEIYKNKADENIMSSRMYNPSAIKRESINYKRI